MKRSILFFMAAVISVVVACQDDKSFDKLVNANQGIETLFLRFKDGTSLNSKPIQVYPPQGIPYSTGSAWGTSIVNNSANWNTAYSWGNHAGLYELKLGNPAANGYILSSTTAGVRTWIPIPGGGSVAWVDITGKPTTLVGYGITDAMSTSHPAYAITTVNIGAWNTAVSWGNHAGLYKPISYVPSWGEITGKPTFATVATSGLFADLLSKPTTVAGYGITNAMTTAHPANAITSTNITNWNAAYSWGNHAGLYRPITWVPTWTDVTGKPATYTPTAHTHDYNTDITNKPPEQDLMAALMSLPYLPVAKHTTTEINALVMPAGSTGIVYDLTLNVYKVYKNGVWSIVITSL